MGTNRAHRHPGCHANQDPLYLSASTMFAANCNGSRLAVAAGMTYSERWRFQSFLRQAQDEGIVFLILTLSLSKGEDMRKQGYYKRSEAPGGESRPTRMRRANAAVAQPFA